MNAQHKADVIAYFTKWLGQLKPRGEYWLDTTAINPLEIPHNHDDSIRPDVLAAIVEEINPRAHYWEAFNGDVCMIEVATEKGLDAQIKMYEEELKKVPPTSGFGVIYAARLKKLKLVKSRNK